MLKGMNEFIKDNSKELLITLAVVTFGAFFIHMRFNNPPDIQSTLIYIPFICLGVFVMTLSFGLVIFGGKK